MSLAAWWKALPSTVQTYIGVGVIATAIATASFSVGLHWKDAIILPFSNEDSIQSLRGQLVGLALREDSTNLRQDTQLGQLFGIAARLDTVIQENRVSARRDICRDRAVTAADVRSCDSRFPLPGP